MTSFEELTDNPVWREEIRRVYDNDFEKVDLMTGLYAEPLPPGFGFSETAFRIFVLMASRRLTTLAPALQGVANAFHPRKPVKSV